jgi:hypothetical protein
MLLSSKSRGCKAEYDFGNRRDKRGRLNVAANIFSASSVGATKIGQSSNKERRSSGTRGFHVSQARLRENVEAAALDNGTENLL